MKNLTIRVDITDPTRPFIHKGWARKGHTYITFTTKVTKSWDSMGLLLTTIGGYLIP